MQEQNEIDIFEQLGDTNFDEVDTSMPVLAPGLYTFEIKDMRRDQWKSGKGSSLTIQLALTEEAVDVSGERQITPGYSIYDRISLVAKGRYDPRQPIKRFLEAVGMADQPFDQTFSSYLGATVTVKTKIEPERTDPNTGQVYSASPAVAAYVRA